MLTSALAAVAVSGFPRPLGASGSQARAGVTLLKPAGSSVLTQGVEDADRERQESKAERKQSHQQSTGEGGSLLSGVSHAAGSSGMGWLGCGAHAFRV